MTPNPAADDEELRDEEPVRGVKTRMIGAGLIFLGVLDSLLSWRGGFEPSLFHWFLIAAGILVFAIGAIRQRRDAGSPSP
ncbi:MAG TPA: hypothetical protein QGF63_09770 [Alphaproteobacteria bacterium]|jgi:hypothetical protein|nr:hypothetical protein [Alphaproteobacteria bacterium]MDP6272283.1 hypothetical protein [Alphaproteobacteria bacterium]MDP7429004.1 hypothetical protein [Alphaproteobacteria bacterium]HJM50122.1 hypothetical protein [Alphaproteobacteria bacterium]|tara:strand:+ start:387 stop:626 length:240 start_codon:yes stop_codon:yes gene_type:complete